MEEDLKIISDGALSYCRGNLFLEGCALEKIAADRGTPCYVYSTQVLRGRVSSLKEAFAPLSPLICYSVKANSNLTVLRLMKEENLGVDVVSEGELLRARKAGFPGEKIVFAGAGKSPQEIDLAVRWHLFCLTVENAEELDYIEKAGARYKFPVRCALRLNLNVDVDTHHYVKTSRKETKFGLDPEQAIPLIKNRRRWRWVRIAGLHFHLGSQIKEPSGYAQALSLVREFCEKTRFVPEILDIGGGFGISYRPDEHVVPISSFAQTVSGTLKGWCRTRVILEPGRYLVGTAGFLLTRVLYTKKRPGGKTF
ncbi:MAG TPA: diaminopimelate decarboxylase, partial [bacterium]|nr:diaminopimelate decarboxylase [bacterium]